MRCFGATVPTNIDKYSMIYRPTIHTPTTTHIYLDLELGGGVHLGCQLVLGLQNGKDAVEASVVLVLDQARVARPRRRPRSLGLTLKNTPLHHGH